MPQALTRWPLSPRLILANNEDMRRASLWSLGLHLGVFLLLYINLPSWQDRPEFENNVVTVELLPVSELTNVRTTKPKPKPKDKPAPSSTAELLPSMAEPITKPAPKIKVKPKEIIKKEIEPLPTIVKPEEKPEPKEEPKEEEVIRQEVTEEDAFASVLKSVESMEAEEVAEEEKEAVVEPAEDMLAKSEQEYVPGIPLSLSEKDAIRQQIIRNWTVLGGAQNAQDMVVSLEIKLAKDGEVLSVEIMDRSRF